MTALPIIVLKFGGSVLATDADAARAAHEVYRWLRDGHRVVAVVSALEGQTDHLLARAGAWTAHIPGPTPAGASAIAALLATGEQQSAAMLALALDRAGVPAEVLDHGAIGLRTAGPPLDATPVGLDTDALLDALARAPVVVVPGFTGRDEHGRTTLLGRGGSDLSALFIASRLEVALASPRTDSGAPRCGARQRVRCRLVKDVDGLYDRDPALPGPRPRRFAQLSWNDALTLDGSIVQHKGVRLARAAGLAFEVAGLLGEGESRVGDHAPSFDHTPRTPTRPLRVTILGAGTVGAGVYHAIARLPEWFEVVAVVARDHQRAAARGIDPALLTPDIEGAIARDCDVVVELLGGLDPARAAVRAALRRGRRVVSANKAILADAGRTPESLTRGQAAEVACSAAVGGAVPCLETGARLARTGCVVSIAAVLNGTTNFVLGRVGAGDPFERAVRLAQDAGLAEADPARDLDGRDAGDKLVLLARAALDAPLDPNAIERRPIDADTCRQPPPRDGVVLRHVARVWRRPDSALAASVVPEWVDASSPLGAAEGEANAVVFTTDRGTVAIHGKGAGRWPTTQGVIADLIDIAHEPARAPGSLCGDPRPQARQSPDSLTELVDAR